MKKFLKILGVVAATLAVVLVIILVLIIRALPSPSEIGRYMKPSTVKSALKKPDPAQAEKAAETAAAETAKEESAPAATSETTKKYSIKGDTEEEKKILDDILNPNQPLSQFCNYLRNAPQSNTKGYTFTEFGQKFKDSVMSEDKDPIIQAIKPTLRFVMQLPQMKEMIRQAQEAADKGETDSLMQKAAFYKQALGAYTELLSHKVEAEEVMDRSYQMMIMAKVIAEKPQLLSDNRVDDYCRSIESAINSKTKVSWSEEQNEFSKFLEETGVDPKSVGYDPNYKTKLDTTYGPAGLNMKGGWIDSVLKPSPKEIRDIEAQAQKPKAPTP